MTVAEEALRRETLAAAQTLSNSPEFSKILEHLSFQVQFNIERCITQTDPVLINRAQGAVQELRNLQALLKRAEVSAHRRTGLRREV